jgi:hypothetical protein
MNSEENKKTLFRCIDIFNKCNLDWIDSFYSHDLIWKESPTDTFPKGRSGGFKEFYAAAEQRLKFFPNNSLTVIKCIAEHDDVVFEQDWRGILSIPGGNTNAGDEVRSKIITIFKLRNNRIIEHIDFVIRLGS